MNKKDLKTALASKNIANVCWVILGDWILNPNDDLRNSDVLRLLDILTKNSDGDVSDSSQLLADVQAWLKNGDES